MTDEPGRGDAERAALLLDAGRPQEARDAAARAVAARPDDAVALRLLALALVRTDRPREAVDVARRSIAADPWPPVAHIVLAEALRALGRQPEAVAAAREAVRRAPGSADACQILALTLPPGPEKVQTARRAVELAPHEAVMHNTFGVALLPTDRRAAREAFERALALDPGHVHARSNLALVSLREGDRTAAVEGFFHAARLDPRFGTARENLQVAIAALVRRGLLAVAVLLLVCVVGAGDFDVTTPRTAASPVLVAVWFAGLAALAVLAVVRLRRLPPGVRRYVWTAVRARGGPRVWAGMLALLVGLGTAGVLAGPAAGHDLRTGALRLLALANLGSWIGGRRRKRPDA